MFTIYQITNRLNGKSYIGFTSQSLELRWKRHQYISTKGSNGHLHRAIRKYGVENFHLEIIEEGWEPKIGKNIREPYWISVLKPEYNMTPGGDGTGTGEQSAKYGTRLSPKTREKIRRARIGAVASEETKLKMSASHRGLKAAEKHPLWGMRGGKSPNFGSKRTSEQKERMCLAWQQRKRRK